MKTTIKMQISSNSSKISWPPDKKKRSETFKSRENAKLSVEGTSGSRTRTR